MIDYDFLGRVSGEYKPLPVIRLYVKAMGGLTHPKSVWAARNSRKRFCEVCGQDWIYSPTGLCYHCRQPQDWLGDL